MSFIDVLATLFYRLIVNPIHCYFSLSCFITCFTFFASPSILLLHAVSILPRPFSSHHKQTRKSSNLRIRRLAVLLCCCQRRIKLSPHQLSTPQHHAWCSPRSKEGIFAPLDIVPSSTPSHLHYFDSYNNLDDILFYDALHNLPESYHNCFDYYDSTTGDYYNRYFDSGLFDIFHDALDTDTSNSSSFTRVQNRCQNHHWSNIKEVKAT